MPSPAPFVPSVVDGETFDTVEKLRVLNVDIIARIQDKFGALVANDLSNNTLEPHGAIDCRSYLVSNVKETMKVINYKEDGRHLNRILKEATTPVTVFIPGDTTAFVTTPAPLRNDCQVIGAGHGSAVAVLSGSLRSVFECTGGKRWALRNLRIQGGRGAAPAQTHHGVFIQGTQDIEGVIDGVKIGTPLIDGEVTNALPRWAVFISNASGVKIHGTQSRFCSSGGFFAKDSSHIEFFDVKSQRNAGPGMRFDRCKTVRIVGSIVQWNNASNLMLVDSSNVLVFGNEIEDPASDGIQTSLIGTKSNVFVRDSSDVNLTENFIQDLRRNTDITSLFGRKTALYQVECAAQPGRLVMVGNYMNETSQTPVHGRITLLTAGVMDGKFIRDQNHILGERNYVSLKRGHGGWKPLGNPTSGFSVGGSANLLQWNCYTEIPFTRPRNRPDENLGVHYQPEFLGIGGGQRGRGREGKDLGSARNILSNRMGILPCRFSDTGGGSSIYFVGMQEMIERLSNKGGVLTPSVIGTDITKIVDEAAAIHATFNIFERSAGLVPEHPSGIYRVEQGNVVPQADWQNYWGSSSQHPTAPGWSGRTNGRVQMAENVLCVYITKSTPYGFDHNVTAGLTKAGPGYIVVWSGVTNFHRDQRPTWVSVHT